MVKRPSILAEKPLPSSPPSPSNVIRYFVIFLNVFALIDAGGAGFNYYLQEKRGQNSARLNIIFLVMAIGHLWIMVICLIGIICCIINRIRVMKFYFFFSIFNILLVISIQSVDLVIHFVWKTDFIQACVGITLNPNALKLTAASALAYCNMTSINFDTSSYIRILILSTLLSISLSVLAHNHLKGLRIYAILSAPSYGMGENSSAASIRSISIYEDNILKNMTAPRHDQHREESDIGIESYYNHDDTYSYYEDEEVEIPVPGYSEETKPEITYSTSQKVQDKMKSAWNKGR